MNFRFKVKVASVQTLYHLVQIRAAWRKALTREDRPALPVKTEGD